MDLLTSRTGVYRRGGVGEQGWIAWRLGKPSSEEECSPDGGFPLLFDRLCQPGQPRADCLGSWIVTEVWEADTETNIICCNKQDNVYWEIIGFYPTWLQHYTQGQQSKHDNDEWPIFHSAVLEADKTVIDKIALNKRSWAIGTFSLPLWEILSWMMAWFYCEEWIQSMPGREEQWGSHLQRFLTFLSADTNMPLLDLYTTQSLCEYLWRNLLFIYSCLFI